MLILFSNIVSLMLFLSSILLRLSWNTRNIFEDLGPLRDSIRDVIVSDDVDTGCMIIRLTVSQCWVDPSSRIADVKCSSSESAMACPILEIFHLTIFVFTIHKGEEKKEEPTDVEHKASYLKLAYESAMDVIKRYSESCRIIECELISEKLYFGIFVRYRRIPIVVVYRPR